MAFRDRLAHAWNAFRAPNHETDSLRVPIESVGGSNSIRQDRYRLRSGNEASIIASIYDRIANDVASIDIRQARYDVNGNMLETINSGLNSCLSLSANLDQNSRDFIMDVTLSMLDEGCVAIVPVDTDVDAINKGSFDILSLRTGKIVAWLPKHVRLEVYNEETGRKQEILMPKDKVAIIENPFYSIMNEPNSTLKRLIYKLKLLDVIDEKNGNAKLDLIIQLPYTIKSPARAQQAENRRNAIISQLEDSDYGIAYIDATEHVTQLNRAVESNLMPQIEYLTKQLYSQLGIGEEVFLGTADDAAMLNYYNRVIEPILSTITLELTRKFLTKTARTQGQKITFFRDPFKLTPVNQIADIADKFTRNEIMTSNEFRAKVGLPASKDPRADELINKNISQPADKINNINDTSSDNSSGNSDTASVLVNDIPNS